MNTPQRYDPVDLLEGMDENASGNYVLWRDYAALQSAHEALQAKLDNIRFIFGRNEGRFIELMGADSPRLKAVQEAIYK